jgi:hypothetical protein
MEKLFTKETSHSPRVSFDHETGLLQLRGNSFLDNAHEFYTPIIDWLREYSKTPAPQTKVTLVLNYINTSSQRMLFDMLKVLGNIHSAGHSVHVDWLYEENDDDLKDVGEDLLSFMEFSYKVIEKVN